MRTIPVLATDLPCPSGKGELADMVHPIKAMFGTTMTRRGAMTGAAAAALASTAAGSVVRPRRLDVPLIMSDDVGFAESVNVLDYGAVGDGIADDRPAIQAAIDYAYANRQNVVFPANVPAYYRISLNLVCRPGVSLRGVGGKAKIKNMNTAGATMMDRSVFLMGNLALNYTQLLTSYDCGTIRPGYAVTLTNIADAANFTAGDQVATLSTATSSSSGFTLNDYLHLNRVTAKAGAVITLQYPIDVGYVGGLARLADVSTTAAPIVLPLYFIDNCCFENLEIEAPGGGMFNGYGGMYNVTVRDCISDGRWGPYANCMQHCRFVNNDWYFTGLMGEFAQNSLHSFHIGSRFYYKYDETYNPEARFQFSEASRNCSFLENVVDVNRLVLTPGFSLFSFSAAMQCCVVGNTITSDNTSSAITVVTFAGRTSGIRCVGNAFSRNIVKINSVRLFAYFSMIDKTNQNNYFDFNVLFASRGDFNYSIRVDNSYFNYIRSNKIAFGAILFKDTIPSQNFIDENVFTARSKKYESRFRG